MLHSLWNLGDLIHDEQYRHKLLMEGEEAMRI